MWEYERETYFANKWTIADGLLTLARKGNNALPRGHAARGHHMFVGQRLWRNGTKHNPTTETAVSFAVSRQMSNTGMLLLNLCIAIYAYLSTRIPASSSAV